MGSDSCTGNVGTMSPLLCCATYDHEGQRDSLCEYMGLAMANKVMWEQGDVCKKWMVGVVVMVVVLSKPLS